RSGGSVQVGVELDALGVAGDGLDGAGDRVAAEGDVVRSAEFGRLDHGVVLAGHGHSRTRREAEARLDHAVYTDGDADTGVGAQQGAGGKGDAVDAATGERAHDGRAAADVRAVADDDALRDASFDHGRSQSAGVVVGEALVHHGRAGGQMSAEADTVGIGDADPGGD